MGEGEERMRGSREVITDNFSLDGGSFVVPLYEVLAIAVVVMLEQCVVVFLRASSFNEL